MMKYRMLALDLDGTLLDSKGKASEANVQAIRRAIEAGMMVALCTGRGLKESRQTIEAIGHRGPLVLANGALISDPLTGKTLHRAVIEPHVALPIIEELKAGDDAVLVLLDPAEIATDYLVVGPERLTTNTRWWFDYVGATWRGVAEAQEEDLHHALRVGIVGPESHMPGVVARLRKRFGEGLFIQHFMAVAEEQADGEQVHILEVFTAGVNKWAGLQWLAGEHGIQPAQIAAIGDQINDVEMISHAGCGVAMGNAIRQVRDLAQRITGTNDEDGVGYAIDRILDGSW